MLPHSPPRSHTNIPVGCAGAWLGSLVQCRGQGTPEVPWSGDKPSAMGGFLPPGVCCTHKPSMEGCWGSFPKGFTASCTALLCVNVQILGKEWLGKSPLL